MSILLIEIKKALVRFSWRCEGAGYPQVVGVRLLPYTRMGRICAGVFCPGLSSLRHDSEQF